MTAPSPIPVASTSPSYRESADDCTRMRALERLYERYAVVDSLIRSLEQYQEQAAPHRAEVISIMAGWKRSSGCAQ